MGNIVWIPAESGSSGGTIEYDNHSGDFRVYNSSQTALCGFSCKTKNKRLYSSTNYECTTKEGFFKIPIPDSPETISEAILYLMPSSAIYQEDKYVLNYVNIRLAYKLIQEEGYFPLSNLSTDDYDFHYWMYIDTIATVKQVHQGGVVWYSVDVTTKVRQQRDAGYSVIGFRIMPSATTPITWDYNRVYTTQAALNASRDEKCLAVFHGQSSAATTAATPGTYTADTGNYLIGKKPIIKITYADTVTYEPTSTITAIDADLKASVCVTGTQIGNLWKVAKVGDGWEREKLYSFGSPITCVCISDKENFRFYPNSWGVYVGLSNGYIYKYSPGTVRNLTLTKSWSGVASFIRADVWGDILVASEDKLYKSSDDGITWTKILDCNGYDITGVHMRGSEIQVTYNRNTAVRTATAGNVWHSLVLPGTGNKLAFGKTTSKLSVIGGGTKLYSYGSGDASYTYVEGAAVDGYVRYVDSSPDGNVIFVATSSKIYMTTDVGETVLTLVDSANVNDNCMSAGGTSLYRG